MNRIYLENMKHGKRTFYVNGIGEKVWYDNFYGSNCSEIIRIKCDSLLDLSFSKIGSVGNCWFDRSNWEFEIENDSYFVFSMNTYCVIWDKINECYIKVIKFRFRKSGIISDTKFTDDDIKRIIKNRTKRGMRVK